MYQIPISQVWDLPYFDNPKSELQYELLKWTYRISEVLEPVWRTVKVAIESVIEAFKEFVNSLDLGKTLIKALEEINKLREQIGSLQNHQISSKRPPRRLPYTISYCTNNTRSGDEIRTFRRKRH